MFLPFVTSAIHIFEITNCESYGAKWRLPLHWGPLSWHHNIEAQDIYTRLSCWCVLFGFGTGQCIHILQGYFIGTILRLSQHKWGNQGEYGCHDGVIKWKHFPRFWPFVRGIHRSPVNSPHKGQWRGTLIFLWSATWINGWVNNREAGDLRRHRDHYDIVMDKPHRSSQNS